MNIKKSTKETKICIPGSWICDVEEALKKDGLLTEDIIAYTGRDPRMKSFSIKNRKKTYKRIFDSCKNNMVFEEPAFDDAEMTRTYIGILSVIIVSHYDEDEFVDYIIKVINDYKWT